MPAKSKNEITTTKKVPAVPAVTSRGRASDKAHAFRAKLISEITELNSELESLNVISALRQWKLGCFLFALKGLSGHGNFEAEFESSLGHVMSFRQAQRYMAKKKEIDLVIPVLRNRLIELKKLPAAEPIGDEDVLRGVSPEELYSILGTTSTKAGSPVPLFPAPPLSLSLEFSKVIGALFKQPCCVLSTEPIEVDSMGAHELRVGESPFTGLTAWPPSVLAISGIGGKSSKWITDLFSMAIAARESATLIAIPLKHLHDVPHLFDFPNLLTSSERIFSLPIKRIPSHFIISFLSTPDRNQDFIESFSNLGTVKVPANL